MDGGRNFRSDKRSVSESPAEMDNGQYAHSRAVMRSPRGGQELQEQSVRPRRRRSFYKKGRREASENQLFGLSFLAPGLNDPDNSGLENLNRAMKEILNTEGPVSPVYLEKTKNFQKSSIQSSDKAAEAEYKKESPQKLLHESLDIKTSHSKHLSAEPIEAHQYENSALPVKYKDADKHPESASESVHTPKSEASDKNENLSELLEQVPKFEKPKPKVKRYKDFSNKLNQEEGRRKASVQPASRKQKIADLKVDSGAVTYSKEKLSAHVSKQVNFAGLKKHEVRKGGSAMLPRDGEDFEIAGYAKSGTAPSAPVDREAGTRMSSSSKVMGMTRERAKKLELQFERGVSGSGDIHRAPTAVNRRPGSAPPPRHTGMQNTSGFGSRTGTGRQAPVPSRTGMQNTSGFGSRTGVGRQAPVPGRTGMNQNSNYGGRTGMNQNPNFGSRTGMNQNPNYGGRTGMNQNPNYGGRTGVNQAPGYGGRPGFQQSPVFGRSTGLNQYNNNGGRPYANQGYPEQPFGYNQRNYGGGNFGYSTNSFAGGGDPSGYGQNTGYGGYGQNDGYSGVVPRNMPYRAPYQGGSMGDGGQYPAHEHLSPAETYAKAVEESKNIESKKSWMKNGGFTLVLCALLAAAALGAFAVFVMNRTASPESSPSPKKSYRMHTEADKKTDLSSSASKETAAAKAPDKKAPAASSSKNSAGSARGNVGVIKNGANTGKPSASPQNTKPAPKKNADEFGSGAHSGDDGDYKIEDNDFADDF